ncbi:MAG TPA: DUF5666 domain-containing protein [Candidatus Limnocylindrales bacterium]|nr:DUF5666 domain-containing protein [Candidatus Limnocylindrales bacterium]
MDEYLTPPEPVQPTQTGHAAVARRPVQASLARIGLLGIASAALIAVAALAFGSTANPTSILAAGTGGTANQPAVVNDLNGRGPGGREFGRGMGGITITAISGNSISLATGDGWTRTITVDDGTTYSKSGATITLGDLKVGDEVGFRETKETNGTFTIDAIVVVLPHAGGQVTAIDGSKITVTQRDGTSATINVTGTTTYTVNGNGASLADVKVGMFLVAEGTKNDDGSLAATNVHAGDKGFGRGHGGDHGFRGGPDGIPGDPSGPDASGAPTATSTAS